VVTPDSLAIRMAVRMVSWNKHKAISDTDIASFSITSSLGNKRSVVQRDLWPPGADFKFAALPSLEILKSLFNPTVYIA